MPGTQELTRRIKSVKSTRKITRAMQMVSAAKMRKSQAATLASRQFSQYAAELIARMPKTEQGDFPLLRKRLDAKKIGIVLITTNKGLVGGFNTNLLGAVRTIEQQEAELVCELAVIGKKGREGSVRLGKTIIADFPKQESSLIPEEVFPIVTLIKDLYTSGEYHKIYLVYNHFVSTLVQKPTIQTLLPFSLPDNQNKHSPYEFEPTVEAVLEHLIPRVLESQIYQAILESDASEHSARMVMMKNATESAGDLIDDLTLTFNQLRQNKITTELSEITAGKIALEEK